MAVGRDNNVNLIRFAAALIVLVSHAWPISTGPGTPEPLVGIIGHSIGSIGVFVFFTLSGFSSRAAIAKDPIRGVSS